jgi:hypothetical protein
MEFHMTDTLKIEAGKEYLLRSGWRMRCYATDGGGEYPVQGAIWDANTDEWDMGIWQLDGRVIDGRTDDGSDIISPAPETVEVDCWVCVYRGGHVGIMDGRYRKQGDEIVGPAAQFRLQRSIPVGEGM